MHEPLIELDKSSTTNHIDKEKNIKIKKGKKNTKNIEQKNIKKKIIKKETKKKKQISKKSNKRKEKIIGVNKNIITDEKNDEGFEKTGWWSK